ncbi:U1 small nuclear ribonucleoprotein c like finger [Cryptosporidium sp. chipmunk genotype I]|uniref:U1 small nuclear ribonucleoprotein c like finger n=1 Tax=Cryptosporidium sp. chipmunk genotype I TaxID=1280935 RepID=UPI00351A41D0|nr:U1 small nuclear ribonucleoprotein c like finger [Cryptosporidium sp. chipmunk genotype I]
MRWSKGVSNKHYCQVCKIWIENHPNNLRSHQEGGRHKYNLRKLLKSENYMELKKKKNEDEIRKEFMKLHGVDQTPSHEKKTIKRIDKEASSGSSATFKANIFTNNYPLSSSNNIFESEDHNENHNNRKNEMGIIGQWEEVKESESAFLGNIILESQAQVQAQNLFKPIEGCVQIKKNSLSQKVYSCISDVEESFEEQQLDVKTIPDTQKVQNEKVKIVFKPRETPR